MANDNNNEAPLDLLRTGRDELIEGSGVVQIAPQPDDADSVLAEPAEPIHVHRCAPEQRELESQSAILRRSEVEKLTAKKPH